MAITYPLALPDTTRGIRGITFNPRSVVGVSRSPFTLTRQVQDFGGQMWQVDVELSPMRRDQAAYWQAFFLKLNGQFGSFLLGDPIAKAPRGVATGTPLVLGTESAGNDLYTWGWDVGITGILKAGDYIQLGTASNARLHMVLEDANSGGSGQALLSIWPRLRSVPAENFPIIVHNTVGVFQLSSNSMSYDIDVTLHYGMKFSAMEVV